MTILILKKGKNFPITIILAMVMVAYFINDFVVAFLVSTLGIFATWQLVQSDDIVTERCGI